MGLEPFTTVAIGTAAANVALPFAKKVLEGIGEKHAADWLENQAGALGVKLMSGVQGLAYYPRVFLFDLPKVKLAESESGSADKLKRLLETGPRALPKRVTIKGNVMPGSLLQFGWWERKNKALLDKGIAWQSDRPIQRWLFSGFEQWAPSWDINDWKEERALEADPPFIAQIGFRDEADSCPVIVLGPKARALRDDLLDVEQKRGIVACMAKVSGVFCSAKYFARIIAPDKANLVRELLKKDGFPPYGIIVREDEKTEDIRLYPDKEVDLYSGYIWRCLCPDKDYRPTGNNISDCYFIWEHTNLADRDCIQYNLDSLDRKETFITKRLKDTGRADRKMVKLQEMTPERRLRGKNAAGEPPLLPAEQFLNIFTKGLDYPEDEDS